MATKFAIVVNAQKKDNIIIKLRIYAWIVLLIASPAQVRLIAMSAQKE